MRDINGALIVAVTDKDISVFDKDLTQVVRVSLD